MKENTSVLMQDIQFDLGEGLLEGVEISANPLIMEDDVLDGYNEETGEWDTLPESTDSTEVYVVIRNRQDLSNYQDSYGINEVVAIFEQLDDAYDHIDSLIESICADHLQNNVNDWAVEYEDEDLWATIKITYHIESHRLQ